MLARAQPSARWSMSVAITPCRPRRASTADSTPVPAPMSKAIVAPAGSGACATSSTYSPRTGENTPYQGWMRWRRARE
jgi:hypothetical protein